MVKRGRDQGQHLSGGEVAVLHHPAGRDARTDADVTAQRAHRPASFWVRYLASGSIDEFFLANERRMLPGSPSQIGSIFLELPI
jgi:hypothetical protein